MIKLILSDVDGTLVEDGTPNLNPKYFDVIEALKNKGIVFAVASGRSYVSISKLFAPVAHDIIIVAENGAYVNCRDYDIHADVMETELRFQIIDDMRKVEGGIPVACCKKKSYVESKDEVFWDLVVNGYKMNVAYIDDLKEVTEDVIKMSLYHAKDAVAASTAFVRKWESSIHAVCAGTYWLDCMNLSVNKGSALRSIQKTLGITKEETMAFGDNLNDIEMLSNAKYSYAVGNARDEVKEVANYIADTNINDGVLQELEKLL